MADFSWIYPTAAGAVTAVLGWTNRRSIKRAEEKVEGVHNEVRPPSNGTTSGSLQESVVYSLAMALPWLIEEITQIRLLLGSVPHEQAPELSDFLNRTPPPERPKEYQWPPPRPPRNQAPPSTSQSE